MTAPIDKCCYGLGSRHTRERVSWGGDITGFAAHNDLLRCADESGPATSCCPAFGARPRRAPAVPGSISGTNSTLVRYMPPSRPPAALARSPGPCGPRFSRLASDRRRLLGPAALSSIAQRRALKTSSDAAVGAVNAGGGPYKRRTS
jgi:hypothetical protein